MIAVRVWLGRHLAVPQTVLTIASVVCVGAYVNLLSRELGPNTSTSLIESIMGLKEWNLLLLLTLVCTILQTVLSRMPQRAISAIIDRLIVEILEAACLSIKSDNRDRHIRAIVTLIDRGGKTRTTRYTYGVRPDPERKAKFPVDFGVTGEAIRLGTVIAQELPRDHLTTYPASVRDLILPNLRCVLAAPIYNPSSNSRRMLGVLAFDSTMSMDTMKFNSHGVKDVAQAWADIIGSMLTGADVTVHPQMQD